MSVLYSEHLHNYTGSMQKSLFFNWHVMSNNLSNLDNAVVVKKLLFLVISLPPEFLPVSGP